MSRNVDIGIFLRSSYIFCFMKNNVSHHFVKAETKKY